VPASKELDEIEIVSENGPDDVYVLEVQAKQQGITHTGRAFWLALFFLGFWGLVSAAVLLWSFFVTHSEPPTWSVAIESATFTGALAMVFRDRGPQGGK
jgi:hypothetical protein